MLYKPDTSTAAPPGLAATSPPLRVSGSCHLAGSRRWSGLGIIALRCSAWPIDDSVQTRCCVRRSAAAPAGQKNFFDSTVGVFGAAGDFGAWGVPSARGERGAKP